MLNFIVNRLNLTGTSGQIRGWKDRLYRQRVMFIHVPKSGGTSLSHALRVRYPLSYFKLSEEAASETRGDMTLGQWMRYKQSIVAYNAAVGAHFIQGHIPVDRNFLDTSAAKYKLITLLRHPIDRVVSHYFFDRRLRAMSPDEFLDSPRGHVETHVLAHFFGELDWDTPADPAAANRAIAALERFAVVGILSKPEAFHREIKSKIGLGLTLPRRNIGAERAGTERTGGSLSPEIMARIQEMCAEDMRVYEHFVQKADRQTG